MLLVFEEYSFVRNALALDLHAYMSPPSIFLCESFGYPRRPPCPIFSVFRGTGSGSGMRFWQQQNRVLIQSVYPISFSCGVTWRPWRSVSRLLQWCNRTFCVDFLPPPSPPQKKRGGGGGFMHVQNWSSRNFMIHKTFWGESCINGANSLAGKVLNLFIPFPSLAASREDHGGVFHVFYNDVILIGLSAWISC